MRPLHPTSLSFWPPHLSSWEWPLLLTKVGGCRNIQIAQDFKLSSRACFAVNVRARKVQKPKEVQHCTVHQLHMGRLPDCPAGNLRILMVSLSQGLDEPGSTVLLPCISLVHTTLYFLGFHCPVFPWFALAVFPQLYYSVFPWFATQCILMVTLSQGLDERRVQLYLFPVFPYICLVFHCISLVCNAMHFNGRFVPGFSSAVTA